MTAPPAGAHREGDPVRINIGRLLVFALNYVHINPTGKFSAGTMLANGGDDSHWVFLGQFGKQDQDLLRRFSPLAPPSLLPFSCTQSSCRVSKLQLKLTWAGEKKIAFFVPLTEIIEKHS